jgi:hypothetical protein
LHSIKHHKNKPPNYCALFECFLFWWGGKLL